MTVHRASDRPSAPQAYQCKITQSTGMATQMQLKVLFGRKSHGRLDFEKEKTATKSCSGELRNGAMQVWRGVVCFSRDFAFRINILNSISTPHKHSFFIITNVLSVSRDLPHPFLTFYFNPNLHHFINNTCNLIH